MLGMLFASPNVACGKMTKQELYGLAKDETDSIAIDKLLESGESYDMAAANFKKLRQEWDYQLTVLQKGTLIMSCCALCCYTFYGACWIIGQTLVKKTEQKYGRE